MKDDPFLYRGIYYLNLQSNNENQTLVHAGYPRFTFNMQDIFKALCDFHNFRYIW